MKSSWNTADAVLTVAQVQLEPNHPSLGTRRQHLDIYRTKQPAMLNVCRCRRYHRYHFLCNSAQEPAYSSTHLARVTKKALTASSYIWNPSISSMQSNLIRCRWQKKRPLISYFTALHTKPLYQTRHRNHPPHPFAASYHNLWILYRLPLVFKSNW